MITVKFNNSVAIYAKDEVVKLPNFVAERFERKGHAEFVKPEELKMTPLPMGKAKKQNG